VFAQSISDSAFEVVDEFRDVFLVMVTIETDIRHDSIHGIGDFE
jgi:hypothetical protein